MSRRANNRVDQLANPPLPANPGQRTWFGSQNSLGSTPPLTPRYTVQAVVRRASFMIAELITQIVVTYLLSTQRS